MKSIFRKFGSKHAFLIKTNLITMQFLKFVRPRINIDQEGGIFGGVFSLY